MTNPGIWAILAAVILLLAGNFSWAMIGTLETRADALIVVEDNTALVLLSGGQIPAQGMPLRVASDEFLISAVATDEYGRAFGVAEVALPDGSYEGTVVTDTIHPIEFLLSSKG